MALPAALLGLVLLLATAAHISAQCTAQNRTVFSAARNSPAILPSNPVTYEVVLEDTVGGFDAGLKSYTVQTPGLYFIHLSAGVPAFTRLNYALNGATSTPSLILGHATFDGELVTSRDDLQLLAEGDELSVSSAYPLYSDDMKQTSLSGFRLDDMMNRLVVFRAARNTPQNTTGRLQLDKLLINVGGAWESCNNQFRAPIDGIYFLSWSMASSPSRIPLTNLYVNGALFTEVTIASGYYNGSDTATQSLMLSLRAGDTAYLNVARDPPIYSDSSYQTSFIGFLYDPVSVQPIAWSLAYPNTTTMGPATIRFSEVLVNVGGAWNATSGQMRIPQTGTYYLKISGVSSPTQYRFNLGVVVNGELLINAVEQVDTVRTNGFTQRSKSLIVKLQAGDQVSVALPTGYNSYSNSQRQTIFVGFLIY